MRMKLFQKKSGAFAPASQPDPFIFRSGEIFYIYATHADGVQLYRSSRLQGEWQYLGFCFTMAGQKNYWAPAVIQHEGEIWLYVSTTPAGTANMHEQSLKVARASSPEGPFQYVTELLPPFSIDAHVVSYKKELYLFYSTNDENAPCPGTYIALDKMLSPTKVEHRPVAVVRPSLKEEIFCRDRFQPGVHWYTIEGAFYFFHNGTHYVTYSGSAYDQPTYFVGYSTAKGNCGDLRELTWQKYPDEHTYHPLLCANRFVEGTGHNSIIEVDGAYWIVYHGRDTGSAHSSEDSRSMRADRLLFDGDRLSVQL